MSFSKIPSAAAIPAEDDDDRLPVAQAVPAFRQHVVRYLPPDNVEAEFQALVDNAIFENQDYLFENEVVGNELLHQMLSRKDIQENVTMLYNLSREAFQTVPDLITLRGRYERIIHGTMNGNDRYQYLYQKFGENAKESLQFAMKHLAHHYEVELQKEIGPRYRNYEVKKLHNEYDVVECDFGQIKKKDILRAWRPINYKKLQLATLEKLEGVMRVGAVRRSDLNVQGQFNDHFVELQDGDRIKEQDRIEVYGIFTEYYGWHADVRQPPRFK